MRLETERLTLIPLTARQLGLWVDDIAALEKQLDCRYEAQPMEGVLGDLVRRQAKRAADDSANTLYHTFWLLLRTADRRVVGSASFKAPPDETGAVEIGYGLGEQHRGSGYMTEAVKAMCRWALEQPGISHITAETERDNTPSRNVLARCGFRPDHEGKTLWWRL